MKKSADLDPTTNTHNMNLEEKQIIDPTDFSFELFGWNITQGPPHITAKSEYLPSPTPMVGVQVAQSSIVPAQTMTIDDPVKPNISYISGTCKPGGGFFHIGQNENLVLNLYVAIPCQVNLELEIAAVNNPGGGPDSGYSIAINGATFNSGWVAHNDNWHTVGPYGISPNNLKAGNNSIVITGQQAQGVWVRSISVSSASAPMEIGYYWDVICQGTLGPGDTYSHAQSYTVGNTNTESETLSFAETLGVSVKAKMDDILSGLSTTFSASFTATEQSTHTIAINESSTETKTITVGCPATFKSKTYQVWRLMVQYGFSPENRLIQGFPKGPIIYREYSEE